MNSRTTIAALLASVAALSASAQVSASADRFSPRAEGYMERALTMRGEGNYAGVIDQLSALDTRMVSLSAEMSEQYTFLLADAYYERNNSGCLRLLMEFRDAYPASRFAPEASMAIADYYYFNHLWPNAVEAYETVDYGRLNKEKRLLCMSRLAVSLIKTGHFEEARPMVAELCGEAGYADVCNYYSAYLDYIDGRFDRAYELFSKVKGGRDGLEPEYYMAQIEYSRGDYAKVISRGGRLLDSGRVPELEPEICRIVGLSYFKEGDMTRARQYLGRYISSSAATTSDDAVYALGAIDYANGDYSEAAGRFSALTSRQDAIGQSAWLYLGQCMLREGNQSSAAMAFEKAARMDADRAVSERALYNYVVALTRGGKVPFSSSSQMLERFVKTYPDSEYASRVESYLAIAYYNDRNYKEALRCIDAIRRPDSDDMRVKASILYQLGVECVTNGRAEEGAGYLKQSVKAAVSDRNVAAQASLWLGDALYSLGRFREAADAYSEFLRKDSGSGNRALGLYNLAYAEYKLKDYPKAASGFASALAAKPALDPMLAGDALIRRGDCLYYGGKYAEASKCFTEAMERGATDADYALYRRAVLHGLSGDTAGKIRDLERLEKEYPESSVMDKALLELALAYEETGRKDKASDAYKRRLAVAGNVDIDELLRMSAAMHEAGRWEDLLEVVGKIRHTGGLEPDEVAEVSLYEADALRGLGRDGEAREIYAALAQTPTSLPGSRGAVMLAEMMLADKEYAQARDAMEAFTEAGTPHQYWLARGFIALADAYHGLGDKALAREFVSSLRENYPGSEQDIADMISSRLNKWK